MPDFSAAGIASRSSYLRSQEQRDVAHIILSAKPGTDKEAFVEAARAMLAREFAGHKYAFALHEDCQHIHVHAVVKMKAETGERLDPKIPDLSRWRETLAHEARERHIPMEALSRFERANPPGYKLKDIRRVERGIAPDSVRRRVDAVRDNAVHVPTREEGKRRAGAAFQGWRDIEAMATKQRLEPALAAGATRLYRADRPGAASTAGAALTTPLFTRDREAAMRMAQRTGGCVSYIDVSPSELSGLKPSRTDAFNQFVVSPELAASRKPLDQPATAAILQFKNRAEQAITGAAQRATSRLIATTGDRDDMANLQTMKATFDDMNTQLNIVEQNLPADKLPELAAVRRKIEANQRDMIAAQENIERKRGFVEGDKYVEPKPRELGNFVSDKRGETIHYSRLREDGEIGKLGSFAPPLTFVVNYVFYTYSMECVMPQNVTVRASDFSRNFARYQDDAIAAKVINVTSHGRVIGAYLSAAELAHYELLKRREREILVVGDLDDETMSAIESAEYGAESK